MAHFAKLDQSNIVTEVLVVANSDILDGNGVEQESLGIAFLLNLTGHASWKQTSYNGNIRKNYAGVGYEFDTVRDAFISPKPFNSWLLNETTCQWEAPIPYPQGEAIHVWNEENLAWEPSPI